AATATLASAASLDARPRLTPQQQLDKVLAGREAGRPVHCISTFNAREMQVIDGTAIVYGWGNTVWVNVPRNVRDLDDDDIMVTHTTGSQLCDLDMIHTVDRTAHFTTGFVSLGEFVPYRKIAKVAAAD
ncbi:MAG: hypothetical protein ACKOPE_14605, partial [Novosphingobium sp.]